LAKLGRENDCLILPQIFHGGFRCPSLLTGVQPVSASEFIIEAPNFEKPRALKSDEIENIKSQFVKSAKMVVDQGLPGIELHGANGYLFTQFLSSQTNTRTDQWGGSLENRSRFLLETARDIRKQIGADKILGVRISPENTKLIHGITIEDMAVVCGELSKLGVDYISLSLWDAVKRPDQHVGKDLRDSTVVEYFRKVIPSDVAIFVSGKIWTHIEAQKAFDLGADFVALGASGIANPRWPVEVWQNKQAPYRFPMTESQMSEIGVSPRFRKYLERWNYVK
ncbi:MAG: hypothetical protein KDD38_10835, partial [Bdellovibrionales bacterium]|nr:hypothetical protein [Bdellovibrionales bacterium]